MREGDARRVAKVLRIVASVPAVVPCPRHAGGRPLLMVSRPGCALDRGADPDSHTRGPAIRLGGTGPRGSRARYCPGERKIHGIKHDTRRHNSSCDNRLVQGRADVDLNGDIKRRRQRAPRPARRLGCVSHARPRRTGGRGGNPWGARHTHTPEESAISPQLTLGEA